MPDNCNWELYELRVAVFLRGEKNNSNGNFSGQASWEFFNISLDLRSHGIGNFQSSDNVCNFKAVFSQLVNLKKIPFGFVNDRIKSDRLNISNLQSAERNKLTLRAAKLYVHSRKQSDHTSNITGVGVLLEGVKVEISTDNKSYKVTLIGDLANLVNL
jgi:hypothetical protein